MLNDGNLGNYVITMIKCQYNSKKKKKKKKKKNICLSKNSEQKSNLSQKGLR